MRRRIPTGVGVLILAAVVAALFVRPDRWQAEQARQVAEAQSFARLARAHSLAELQDAVDTLGVVFKIQGGGWIAVRYHDSHAGRIWSSAVARDSGGKWFVSHEHFCGRFHAYRLQRSAGQEGDVVFRAIEAARNLDAARDRLMALGFEPATPPE